MLKRYDHIKENRQGAKIETVLSVVGNVVETYEGNTYHHTKIIKVNGAYNAQGLFVEISTPIK